MPPRLARAAARAGPEPVTLRVPPHQHGTQRLLHMTSIWENGTGLGIQREKAELSVNKRLASVSDWRILRK